MADSHLGAEGGGKDTQAQTASETLATPSAEQAGSNEAKALPAEAIAAEQSIPDVYGSHIRITPPPYQNTRGISGIASMVGVPQGVMMPGLNTFDSPTVCVVSPSQSVAGVVPLSAGVNQRPLSIFSLAISVNPLTEPSQNSDPSDEVLFQAVRNYLSTQDLDLMTVTKK